MTTYPTKIEEEAKNTDFDEDSGYMDEEDESKSSANGETKKSFDEETESFSAVT